MTKLEIFWSTKNFYRRLLIPKSDVICYKYIIELNLLKIFVSEKLAHKSCFKMLIKMKLLRFYTENFFLKKIHFLSVNSIKVVFLSKCCKTLVFESKESWNKSLHNLYPLEFKFLAWKINNTFSLLFWRRNIFKKFHPLIFTNTKNDSNNVTLKYWGILIIRSKKKYIYIFLLHSRKF